MNTAVHKLIRLKAGESVRITFTVKDKDGNAVDVSTGTAVYKVGRLKQNALLTLNSSPSITLSSNTVVVTYNTASIVENSIQAIGKFSDQLKVTLNGDSLFVSEGEIEIQAVIN